MAASPRLPVVAALLLLWAGGAAGCAPSKEPWPKAGPGRAVSAGAPTRDYTSAVVGAPDGPVVDDLASPCDERLAGKSISIHAKAQDAASLLAAVARQSGIPIEIEVDETRPISVSLDHAPLRAAIETIAAAAGLRADLRDCAFVLDWNDAGSSGG